MNRETIYKEIQKVSSYQYFDIVYKQDEYTLIKDTIKLIDLDDEFIKVGFVGYQYTIPLSKVAYVCEANDIVLRYRLKSEYLGVKNTDERSLYLFNALTKLLGDKDKAVAFIERK